MLMTLKVAILLGILGLVSYNSLVGVAGQPRPGVKTAEGGIPWPPNER